MNNQPPALKVVIPRLGRSDHSRKSPQNKHAKQRVSKACENCRKRKVKCSSERPHCRNCAKQHMPCTYPQARRDRLEEVIEQNNRLISFLKNLTVHVDDGGREKIKELLISLGDDSSTQVPKTASEALRNQSREGSTSDENRSAASLKGADVSRSVSSEEGLDLFDDDLLQSHKSRATSVVKQNSSNSFHICPASSNYPFLSHTRNYFPWGWWEMPYFSHPIMADVGAQFLGPRTSSTPSGFILDPCYQTPSIFGTSS